MTIATAAGVWVNGASRRLNPVMFRSMMLRSKALTGRVVAGLASRQTRGHERKNRCQAAVSPQRRTPGDRPAQQDRRPHRRAQDQDRHAPLHRGRDELQAQREEERLQGLEGRAWIQRDQSKRLKWAVWITTARIRRARSLGPSPPPEKGRRRGLRAGWKI